MVASAVMKIRNLSISLSVPVFMVLVGGLVGACGEEATRRSSSSDNATTDSTTSSSSSSSSSSGGGAGGADGTGGGGGGAAVPLIEKTISGDLTWTVTFDDAAKMAGATDCIYTRHYEGVEDRSAPWLCPSCEIMFRADVQMTVGQADCFSQVSTSQPAAAEWIGYGNGSWWRGIDGPTSQQGTAVVSDPDVTTMNTVLDLTAPVGGKMQFVVNGALKLGQQDGDPLHGWVPPATYACGWPKANPPAYKGDYKLSMGGELPDGLFRDKCGEVVRLHDFKGSYLVVDMSAMDCPPCQAMAGAEEQFVSDMKAQGIDVHVITLLAPSLSNPLGTTTKANLNTWITKYNLTSPVLGDRGWGLAMFEPAFGDQTGYPSWVVVTPDLKMLQYMSGFSSWDDFKTIILADAAP